MEGIPLSRASQLIHVTDTLERHGFSAERILGEAQLPMWHYCDPEDLIPTHHIFVLMNHAARSTGDPNFGLMVGAETTIATMGAFGRLVASSLTTYHAFATACGHLHLHTSASQTWLTEGDDEVWFCRSQFHGPEVGRWQMEQYVLMRLIEYVRMASGNSWRPAKICLQTREKPDRRLLRALGEPEVRIGQKLTGIAVPRALLGRPLRQNAGAIQDRRRQEEALFRQGAPCLGLVDTLRQLARTLLKEGLPQIGTMAGIAGLSVRSLQRRLAARGLTYSQLLDQARFQAARGLLEQSDIRITDIGMELGYADSAHFTRAFKRWAGVSPREYRSHQQMH